MRKLDANDLDRLAATLGAAPDLLAAWCFGSQVDPDRAAPRDLDIAVLAAAPIGLARLLELRTQAAAVVGSDALDLVDLCRAGPVLRFQALKSGRLLFARDRSATNRFELRVLRGYQDSQYRRRVQLAYLAQGYTGP